MPSPRKQHTQTVMAFRTHGGKRQGAGRPPKGRKSSERHGKRPAHDAHHPVHVTLKIDPYASSIFFEGWKEREHEVWCYKPPKGYEPLVVWRPRPWLLKTGWAKHHGMISMREVPGE